MIYQENGNKDMRINKWFLMAAVLVIAAGLLGWWFGRSDAPSSNTNPTTNTQTKNDNKSSSGEVGALVSYELPDGWKQVNCEGSGAVFVTPNGTTADCNANPVAPIKLSVDPADNKDCNQLQNVSDVKKHVCISLYINGLKSLKASTEFLASSSYKKETTINAYYIDTGKGVVKAEYIYNSDNQFQAGFDQLANSVNVKN